MTEKMADNEVTKEYDHLDIVQTLIDVARPKTLRTAIRRLLATSDMITRVFVLRVY